LIQQPKLTRGGGLNSQNVTCGCGFWGVSPPPSYQSLGSGEPPVSLWCAWDKGWVLLALPLSQSAAQMQAAAAMRFGRTVWGD